MNSVLTIKNLHTYFNTEDSVVKAVEGVNLLVKKGEVLGLVGESACGKTITAYSILQLIQPPGEITSGEILFEGKDLTKISSKEIQKIRGREIALIFQEPTMALNPLYTVGFQIDEMLRIHYKDLNNKERERRVLELLDKVGIENPKVRIKDYPHNLSGGQAQRVMIAMSLSCNPKILIADEPTTSLDVTIQAQIMGTFMRLKKESDFTLILITHNLALCSLVADRIAIMYAGRIVEEATTEEILKNPLHPYTKALFESIPKGEANKEKLQVIEGVVADPANKPSGCHFNPRCPNVGANCREVYPEYREINPDHWVSCYYAA